MNARTLDHSQSTQTTMSMRNMTTIMQRTISTMVKETTWMVLETVEEEMTVVAEVRIQVFSVLEKVSNNGIHNRL